MSTFQSQEVTANWNQMAFITISNIHSGKQSTFVSKVEERNKKKLKKKKEKKKTKYLQGFSNVVLTAHCDCGTFCIYSPTPNSHLHLINWHQIFTNHKQQVVQINASGHIGHMKVSHGCIFETPLSPPFIPSLVCQVVRRTRRSPAHPWNFPSCAATLPQCVLPCNLADDFPSGFGSTGRSDSADSAETINTPWSYGDADSASPQATAAAALLKKYN